MGDDLPKKEKFPEESKDSLLNPENSLVPASGDRISTDTAVSKNFSEHVPGFSSSALVNILSSCPYEFQMQKNNEGIFKNSDFQPMCLSFPLRFPCLIKIP